MSDNTNIELKISVMISCDVPEEILNQNRQEINENPATVKKDIEEYRTLILKDVELYTKLDDDFLLRFLRARKFDKHRALKLIQEYYRQRYNQPELFKQMKPSLLKHLFDDNMQYGLPHRDHLGRRIGICRITQWDPTKCTIELIILSFLICMEKLIVEEETQLCGFCGILDTKDLSFYQARNVSIFNLRNAANLLQKCFPARVKALHVVNAGPVTRTIMAVAKTLVTKKLANRVHIHGHDMSSLHKHINTNILPHEYGGEQPPMDNRLYYQSLLDIEDYLTELLSYGYGKKKQLQ